MHAGRARHEHGTQLLVSENHSSELRSTFAKATGKFSNDRSSMKLRSALFTSATQHCGHRRHRLAMLHVGYPGHVHTCVRVCACAARRNLFARSGPMHVELARRRVGIHLPASVPPHLALCRALTWRLTILICRLILRLFCGLLVGLFIAKHSGTCQLCVQAVTDHHVFLVCRGNLLDVCCPSLSWRWTPSTTTIAVVAWPAKKYSSVASTICLVLFSTFSVERRHDEQVQRSASELNCFGWQVAFWSHSVPRSFSLVVVTSSLHTSSPWKLW